VRRLLLIAVFLEVGIVLLVVPWTVYWERNYFADALPAIHAFITNDFVRGAVTGLGILNLFAGASELVALFVAERSDDPQSVIARSHVTEK